uniref:Uncharacterized protein n=1 Tax=Heterorhabditis bacteriophora TaxID=37862 RepID=A0A1I7X085_HETBA
MPTITCFMLDQQDKGSSMNI